MILGASGSRKEWTFSRKWSLEIPYWRCWSGKCVEYLGILV